MADPKGIRKRPPLDWDEPLADSLGNGMLRRSAFAVADVASLWTAFLVSALVVGRFQVDDTAPLLAGDRVGLFIAFMTIAAFLLWLQRGRGNSVSRGATSLGWSGIVGVASFASMLAALTGVLTGANGYSPEFAVVLWGLSLVAIPAGGSAMAAGLKLLDGRQGTAVTVVVGAHGASAEQGWPGSIEMTPLVSNETADSNGKANGIVVHRDLESLPDLLQALGSHNAGVVVAVVADGYAKVKPIVTSQSLDGCRVRIALLPPNDNGAGMREADAPRPTRFSWRYETAKRWLDLALALASLAVAAPLFAIIAIAIRLDSPGPIFFGQTRVGRDGLLFQMYKFRSMRRDAEDMLEDLTERNEASGAMFKISEDPRVTWVGRFIRRLSLDELPQLLNVVEGTMSIVGPRPPLSSEVAEYQPWHFGRLDAVPGITGLWQVCRGSGINFDDMVRLDLRYIKTWSILRDAAIIVRTIPTMLKGNGAY